MGRLTVLVDSEDEFEEVEVEEEASVEVESEEQARGLFRREEGPCHEPSASCEVAGWEVVERDRDRDREEVVVATRGKKTKRTQDER